MTTPITDEAEAFVRRVARFLTRVRDGECLCCYVDRQLEETAPCDGTLRHAVRFRDAVAPRATSLHERLGRVGGYCDCEVFMNGYTLHPRYWTPEHAVDEGGYLVVYDAEPPDELPPCAGVRRGSVQPCSNWVRIRRW